MGDLFTFSTPAFGEGTLVAGFHGYERISAPFRFDIFLSTNASGLDLDGAAGSSATLTIDRGDPSFTFSGVLAEAELVERVATRAILRVALVPRLYRLGLSFHSRVYTKQSIPDVVKAVLEAGSLTSSDYEFRLTQSYDPEEHVCQHKESDLAFISRWLEHEGIYYFFEQDGQKDKLVITDDKGSHEALRNASIRYFPRSNGDVSAGESFRRFVCKKRIVTGKVKVKDYDYQKPGLDLSGEVSVGAGGQQTEVVEHGARFFTPDKGRRLATVRAEEQAAGQSTFEAEGPVYHLRSGYLFEIEDHPRAAFNAKYLCTAVEHRGVDRAISPQLRRHIGASGLDPYEVRAEGILALTQHRAPRRTPEPRLAGIEHALIDGPIESDYAQLDDDGRYKLKLAFDESDNKDGKASTAIRMMQPHAGNPEGFHFPQRKGTEALVAFLAGHPDRPVIAGTVPNAITPSPVTSANHTRNIIHTGSDNHIEIEDLDGKQWIDFRTPPKNTFMHLGTPHDADSHYIVLNTQGDCLFEIGSNQDITVGAKLTEKVHGAVIEKYNTSQTSDVQGPQKTTVKGAVEETYSGGHHTTTNGLVLETYAAGQRTTVSGGLREEKYEVGQTSLVSQGVKQTFSTGHDLTQEGASTQLYQGTFLSTATGHASFHYSSVVTHISGPVVRISGPTTWRIPGGTNVFTGTWSLTQTNRNHFSQALTEFILFKAEGTIVSLSFGVISASASAISISATGVSSATSFALSQSTTGASLSLVGLAVDVDVLKCIAAAIILLA